MCGITGIYHFNNSKTVEEAEIIKMRDTMIHRGPDDAGIYISPNNKVGLGTRRLKIIDLSSAGHMPMGVSRPNSKPSVWITYNGEVYNFRALKKELEKRGYQFRSRTDTEVILNAYIEYGFDCVKKFNGMFSFVIWDDKKKIFFAARDHLGIKPFYYTVQDGTFYFGSEIKAIIAHPDFKKELNEEGVSHYLTFGSSPAPYTLFKDVKKLPAAHYLVVQKSGAVEEVEYWAPTSENQQVKSEKEYIEETRSLLRDSIRAQMVSDVPFGCFLSGGIDSSTNAALMSEALGQPVEMFSVGYKDFEAKNEFEYSRKVAKFIGTKKPHEILLDESHMREFLQQYAHYADDPNSDPACFPLFWLSKLTRDSGVTVIQIGEGADEIFAGYEQYLKAIKLQKIYNSLNLSLPNWTKSSLYKIGFFKFLHNASSTMGKEYVMRLIMGEKPFWGLAIAFGDYTKRDLLSTEFKNKMLGKSYRIVEARYEELRDINKNADFLKQMTYLDIKHRLPEFLLARADKMTMAHSVEGRVPFLDHRLVELALSIPENLKLKNNTTKYILKKAVEGIIPDEIISRKKQGFSNPISEWLRPEHAISKDLTNIIFDSKLKQRKILNYKYVKRLIHTHQNQGIDQSFKIWNLVTLSLWYDYWID